MATPFLGLYVLYHLLLGHVAVISKVWFSNLLCRIVAKVVAVILLSDECRRNPLLRSQQWFGEWLDVARQEAVIRANVVPVLYRHIASQSFNDLSDFKWEHLSLCTRRGRFVYNSLVIIAVHHSKGCILSWWWNPWGPFAHV